MTKGISSWYSANVGYYDAYISRLNVIPPLQIVEIVMHTIPYLDYLLDGIHFFKASGTVTPVSV